MACSGLNIPCDENSSIYVFDHIFADIGDDQSILESLSTFSSHLVNIVAITKQATENSLILLDELGSGTDPLEGANLAISILDYFKNLGSLVISTTHYQELKQYALVTEGFENASVEFDLNTLSPTYRLLVGIPGKSNAFEISQKLGLPKSIIEKAQSFMTSEQIDFETLLKSIQEEKSLLEEEKLKISQELETISALRKSLERENDTLKQQEENLIYDAKMKARNILLEAKEDASRLIKKMNASSTMQELEKDRNTLNKKLKDLHTSSPSLKDTSSNQTFLNAKDVKPNLTVWVTTLKQKGVIVSHISKSNEVQVQIGSMKMSVPLKCLQLISPTTETTSNHSTHSISSLSKTRTAKSEINVIGLNVEEAIFVVDKFLDDSILAKLQTIRIVHGKGTGKLRNGIHHFLKTHTHVASFRLGTYGEGETGVTVVELKK